ncbi:DUF4292 domain-containing protein [Neptunitalea lumnitzerae]|uniref:Deoxyuridine 5'-triphosphate nucleotidohydrolase n=1 Tax=Neptunitalea lumnitzerae TaxID=2965509 RepID=A0ABQ5MFC1_9FLAO|nr:DUF4292 domain-containing protein [Neptunitalea sp. Y10]GLB48103.1 hypothetical protein Y10_04710 [Neptunitalea sp. Y10]
MKLLYKGILIAVMTVVVASCASKKVIGEGTANTGYAAKKIIKNHYINELEFTTIKGKVDVKYKDEHASNSFSLNLRMEKDKAIWLSAFFGVVKAYITPEGVSFYNKLEGTYFEGDFAYISDLLGTEIDFEKLQNVLLGQAIVDLKQEKYNNSVVENRYQLKPEDPMGPFKLLFQLEPIYYKMSLQEVSQPSENRVSSISYTSYQNIDGQAFPDEIAVSVDGPEGKSDIEIEYKNIEFNKKVTFPYNVPNGYKQITLEK